MAVSGKSKKELVEEISALRVRLNELEHSETEGKNAQDELRKSKEFLNNVINALDDSFFVKDQEHRWLMLNDAACELMGRPREEFIGKSDYDLFPKEQADVFWEKDNLVFETGRTNVNEEKVTWRGKEHTISTKKSLYTDPVTSKKFITGTIRDITELKQTEKRLRESEDKLQAMLGSLAEHISMMDKELNVIWANETAMNIFGGDIVGKKCFEAYHRRNKPCEPYPCLTLKVFQDGKVHEHDTQVVDKDGNTRHFHCNANVALRDEQGNPTAVLEISKDITEQRLNQKALKESEEKFRSLAEQSPNMIFINKDNRVVYANKKCEEIMGYTREEFYSPDFDFISLISPESLDQIKDVIRKRSKGEDIEPYEYTLITKTGQRIEAINSSKLIQYDGESAILGVVTDITERKLAEDALQESESSYRAVVENSTEGIVVVQDQMLQFVNPALVSIVGYSEKELLTRPFIEFIHPDHRERVKGIHMKRLEGEEVPPFYEFKVLDKKGNVKWLENNGILFEWSNRPATLNFLRDITDRKKAEQAIWASESEKRSILNAISDHIIFHETDLLVRWCNEAAAKSIGMTQRELVGCYCYELWQGRGEPCERCPVLRAIETGSYAEGIMTTPDGKLWEIVGEPVCNMDGKIMGAIEISRDITERKRAEEALRQSEQRLKILFESAPDAIYLNDLKGNFVDGNKATEVMLGCSKDELIGKNFFDAGLISSEQLLRAIANIEKNALGKPAGPDEFTLKRKDGSSIDVEIRAFPVRIGDQILSLGIARDISDRKKAERKLHEHRAQLKSLASELSLTEERERHRLATDLHDQISQALVISRIKLQALHASVSSAEITGPLEEVCDNLERIIQDTRALTFDLSSPILYELGFEAAVSEWLEEQVTQKHGIKSQFEDDRRPKPLEDDIRVLLFRNVRELLINIIKHADAQNVKVSVRRIHQHIYVSVEDDGVGFNPAEVVSNAGFGIFSVRERLEQLGGHIEIESEPGQGTKITMTAPLKCEKIPGRDKIEP